ncbi:hypothetical protein [Paenibacillus sp. DMB20]|uniref:hypothetical protein n=1 Tax=Paenibacillus sp. DMB20 TaxID=1642570 RepID=UPI000627A0A2|nr:hypothetical protein [Paenibacillus sp. DMB20]KKO51111.1 hypothetical protein XI25_29430 [Paenibacillus sp. DMB20]
MFLTNRRVYLELAKIAKERGTLTSTLLRVYKRNMVRAYRREKAAEATAAKSSQYQYNYSYYNTNSRWVA